MKKMEKNCIRSVLLPVLCFVLMLACALFAFKRMGTSSDDAQVDIIEKAVHNAMLTCYAVEGRYPMSLSYLKENYGVAYDEEHFSVFYDAFASNIMPEVRVRARGGTLR